MAISLMKGTTTSLRSAKVVEMEHPSEWAIPGSRSKGSPESTKGLLFIPRADSSASSPAMASSAFIIMGDMSIPLIGSTTCTRTISEEGSATLTAVQVRPFCERSDRSVGNRIFLNIKGSPL